MFNNFVTNRKIKSLAFSKLILNYFLTPCKNYLITKNFQKRKVIKAFKSDIAFVHSISSDKCYKQKKQSHKSLISIKSHDFNPILKLSFYSISFTRKQINKFRYKHKI